MASGESKDKQLHTPAILSGPDAAPILNQSERLRKWRCCDCASLNRIRSPQQRQFVSHLLRSLPAASLANSLAHKPVRYAPNFSSEKVSDLEKALAALDAGMDDGEGGGGGEEEVAGELGTSSGMVLEEVAPKLLVCWAGRCEHVRCRDCFDVDGLGRLIARCGGQRVDEGEYLSWCYLMGK